MKYAVSKNVYRDFWPELKPFQQRDEHISQLFLLDKRFSGEGFYEWKCYMNKTVMLTSKDLMTPPYGPVGHSDTPELAW